MLPWDQDLFVRINTWPDSLAPMFEFFSVGIKGLALKIILGVVAVALLAWPRTRLATILALLSWPLANLITDILKNTLPMLRPSVDFPEAIVRVERLSSPGTASAHAANMMAVAVAFMIGLAPMRKTTWPLRGIIAAWFAVAILTGLSRIYVGVHYPTQVLIGFIVGAVAAVIVAGIGRKIDDTVARKREGCRA